MDEPSLSDHRMIMFDVKGTLTTTFTYLRNNYLRNPGNIDWESYIALLGKSGTQSKKAPGNSVEKWSNCKIAQSTGEE